MATAAIDFAFVKSAHASSGQFVDFDEQLEVCRSEVWRNEFEDIIGTSRALGEVLEQVRIVAPTAATVLITGEAGSGKELIAKAIHMQSERRAARFVRLNCGEATETSARRSTRSARPAPVLSRRATRNWNSSRIYRYWVTATMLAAESGTIKEM
jgi:transcriptional regulator with GAF, ATPase, and Fis domain